jgi:hypothetical protein
MLAGWLTTFAPTNIGGYGSLRSQGRVIESTVRTQKRLSSSAKAAIQYSRDVNDRAGKPRRAGSPAFAGDDK